MSRPPMKDEIDAHWEMSLAGQALRDRDALIERAVELLEDRESTWDETRAFLASPDLATWRRERRGP